MSKNGISKSNREVKIRRGFLRQAGMYSLFFHKYHTKFKQYRFINFYGQNGAKNREGSVRVVKKTIWRLAPLFFKKNT